MAYTHNPGRNAFTYPTSHLEVDPVQPSTDASLQSQYQQQRNDPYNTESIQAPTQYGSSHSQSGNSGSGSAAAYYPKSSTYSQAPQYRSKQLQNIAYYRQHNRLPFPNSEKLLGWQNWTIPIPFIPMKRPIPLVFAAVWLILCAYWNGVLAIVGQNRQQLNVRTMPDVGHDIFHYYGTYGTNKIEPHNIYIGIFGALTVIRFLTTRSFFWEIARRFLFIWGCMFILRGATDGLTQETRTTDRCTPSFAIGSDPWTNGWHYVFGGAKTCSDLMFSGHTVAFTLLALQWSNYSTGAEFALCCARPRIPKFIKACFLPSFTATGDVESCWIVPMFFWFVAVGGYILLIADRAHYSVDVFVAAMLTVAIYKLYLFYAKTCYDHDSFLSAFVIWFEGLTPPLPGQAYLSVMECGGYSTKTTAALPPEWTWFDVIEPPVYDQEMIARQYGGPQAGTQVEMGSKPGQYSDDRHPAYASQTTSPTDDIERGHPQIVRPSQERYSNQPFRGAPAVQQQPSNTQYGQQSNEQYHASVPDYQQQSQPTSYTTSNVGSNY